MIKALVNLFEKYEQPFSCNNSGENFAIFMVDTDSKIYSVTREFLQEFGVQGKGSAGGGIEIYELKNGTHLAINWNEYGESKFYLGRMGKAY